ncbi:membrane protein YdbS with pleckstrin-like domain [Bacillus fengqiuensis]|nr:membrane protein YdbS with pleckstrin-like domain [Bacillus fengqiuensis]
MNPALTRPKWMLFLFLVSLVFLSNWLLYTLPQFSPIPNGAVYGSLFDFLITIPVLTYFFIIRKRYSLKYLIPVIFAGYAAGTFIIPNEQMQQFTFVPYLLFAGEAALLLVELYILYQVLTKIPKLICTFHHTDEASPYFFIRLKHSMETHLSMTRLISIFLSEITMFYYALFSWKKKAPADVPGMYTFHQKTSTIALHIMLIHALVLESVGFHYFLHQWNEIAAWVLLALNVYTLLFFLGEIQAIRLCPVQLTEEKLVLQIGLTKSLSVPLEKINKIQYYDGPEKWSKQESKMIFDGTAADFMKKKPTFEISLKEPITAHYMYGFEKKVDRIFMDIDESDAFYQTLKSRLAHM